MSDPLILSIHGKTPRIDDSAFVAPGCRIIGDVEIGPDATRGTFGCSPGDDTHPEPYVYVTHWNDVAPDRFWNDAGGSYASRSLSALRAEPDHREAALAFCRDGRRLLQG